METYLGNYVWIGERVWIDNLDNVTIGNHVCISQGAMLICGSHNYKQKSFDLITKEITLNDGVWIGAKSIILPGVVAESHAILGAGSVISKNLESFTEYIKEIQLKKLVLEIFHENLNNYRLLSIAKRP